MQKYNKTNIYWAYLSLLVISFFIFRALIYKVNK